MAERTITHPPYSLPFVGMTMGYQIVKMQNASDFPGNPAPTIVIKIGDEGWNQAYENWLNGKNPTDSKEWKRGVIACSQEVSV